MTGKRILTNQEKIFFVLFQKEILCFLSKCLQGDTYSLISSDPKLRALVFFPPTDNEKKATNTYVTGSHECVQLYQNSIAHKKE